MPTRPSADHAGPTYHVVNRAAFGQLLYEDFGEYLAYVRLMAWALEPIADRTVRVLPDAQSLASVAADACGARHERLHASADDDARASTAWLARHTRPRRRLPEPIQGLTRRERFVFLQGRSVRRAESSQGQVRGTSGGLDVVERVARRHAPGGQARAMAAPAATGLADLRQRLGAAARPGLHETPRRAPRALRRSAADVAAPATPSQENRGCL